MIIAGAVVNELSEATIAAYDAPFPTEDLKVGRSGVLRLTCVITLRGLTDICVGCVANLEGCRQGHA